MGRNVDDYPTGLKKVCWELSEGFWFDAYIDRQSAIFFFFFLSPTPHMATFVILRHPITILVIYLTNPDNFTNDLFILKLVKLFTSRSLKIFVLI